RLFEKVVLYCDKFISLIPLSFVLGFYVAYVATRWWQQFMAIPWPDKVMHSLALYVNGTDEQSRMLRRTLMRYLNLSLILVLRSISSAVKRRFPTMDHLVEAGFMTPLELEMFQSVPNEEFNTYWIPCTWFISLIKKARRTGRINDSQGLKIIMEEFNEFRSKCGLLWSYDWISIPLVYTQVVTLATYSFFLAALVGRQYVEKSGKELQMEIDIYLPVFTILQFFFFMGLLKVAEQLINPFGDDDEDFELNWLIDRHTKVSYLGVDTLMARCPPLVKDKYFDSVNLILPYTGAAVAYKKKTYRGSVHDMMVPEDQQSMFLPEIIEEDEVNDPSMRAAPKSSFPNIFNMTSASPSAGIWRNQDEETKSRKKDRVQNGTEMRRWSSNSTVDSFCSTSAPGIDNTSFDVPSDNDRQENEETTPDRKRRRTLEGQESPASSQSRSNLPSMFLRRQSSGSSGGQWKGVRWKPMEPSGECQTTGRSCPEGSPAGRHSSSGSLTITEH
ncbi:hypothetical protein AAG570_006163, partial [Ranatra chinensis]